MDKHHVIVGSLVTALQTRKSVTCLQNHMHCELTQCTYVFHTASVSLHSIRRMDLLTETHCVLCEVKLNPYT